MKKLFLSEKRKLGSLSIVSIVLALAAAAALVAGFDAVEKRFAFRIDCSYNSITTSGRETARILRELDSDVHVYALFSPGKQDKTLISILERYASASKHFTFSLENLTQNPALIHSISSSIDDGSVSSDCLIIHGLKNDRTRILNLADYLSESYDLESGRFYISGFNYEKKLSEAVLFVTAPEVPAIQVLSGHGELTEQNYAPMKTLLEDYNYSMKPVDLLKGDVLNPLSPLMILSPVKDLSAVQLEKINAFTRAGGSLFITMDFSLMNELPNFKALYLNYGFIPRKGLVVAAQEETESYYDSPAVLMPYMEMSEPTAALIDQKQTTLILAGAMSFEEPRKSSSLLTNGVLLRSGKAYLRDTEDNSKDISQKGTDPTGTFPLALIGERVFEDGTHSKAFIIGNSSLFTDSWLYQNTYSGEFLLRLISYLGTSSPVSLSIQPKAAIRPPLQMTIPAFNYLVLILLPFSILILAMVVLLPRRRR